MAKQMVPFNTVRAMPNIGLRTYRILILNHTGRPKKTLKELRGITGDPQTDLKSVLKKKHLQDISYSKVLLCSDDANGVIVEEAPTAD